MQRNEALTKQEQAVLHLVAKGWRSARIAQELFISPRTVESHLYRIFDKLGVSSRTEAALYVMQNHSLANPAAPGNTGDVGVSLRYSELVG